MLTLKNIFLSVKYQLLLILLVVLAYWPISSGQYFFTNDMVDCWLPWRHFIAQHIKSGEFPLWNPYQACGVPIYADLQGPLWSPESFLTSLFFTHTTKALSFLSYADDESSVRAAIIFTDGAVNSGANPLYELDYFGRPVYTVGIGDSMPPKDLSIQSILSNELCYVGSKVPVSITVQASGFPNNTTASLSLYDNGNIVGKQTVNIVNTLQTYSVGFTIIPTNPGIHKLTASIQPLANEITIKNNSLSEFITVLKHKRVIALFAGSPSAD
jgi:hypothetical protein